MRASVHDAVREPASEVGRDALTVPVVAQRAGVTPSTVHRRWGDLQEPDEMASPSGRAYIRDALLGDPDGGNAGRCSAYAAEQIEVILGRAAARGERTLGTETVVDHVVAPLRYRILFRPDGLDAARARSLVALVLAGTE
ncbi:TetR-like C-terminal domain-containing protein [Streptomyces parvulus]|uniref:TetR-like C-terminal domain-containing protein n=1 Tax=Streptomyces parvulus TaxID=146923 RepID=UPI0036841091